MQGQTQTRIASKANVGRWLFWMGLAVFAAESWFLIMRLSEFWQGSGAATLGWLAGLGATAQRALSLLVWNQGMVLAAMTKLLVLCCPLVILLVGLVIMKNVAHASEAGSVKERGTSGEGDGR
jgi:hypothetical protein